MNKLKKPLVLLVFAVAFTASSFAQTITPCVANLQAPAVFIESRTEENSVAILDNTLIASALPDSDITIEELPDPYMGRLAIGPLEVHSGDLIRKSDIQHLRFIPTQHTVGNVSFTFKADSGDLCEYTVKVVPNGNKSPVVGDTRYTTFKDVSLRGRLTVKEQDNGITFKVVTEPKKGTVEVRPDGTFTYTPKANFTGIDTFTYKATDKYSCDSQAATVTVNVENDKGGKNAVTYSDINDYNVSVMSSQGICDDILIAQVMANGSKPAFNPDKLITKGEFLMMTASAIGLEWDESEYSGFANDDSIPSNYKGVLQAAYYAGIINGEPLPNGQLVFSWDKPITSAEASSVIISAFNLNTVSAMKTDDGETSKASEALFNSVDNIGSYIPKWALSAISTLSQNGIYYKDDPKLDPYKKFTRLEATDLISAVMQLE